MENSYKGQKNHIKQQKMQLIQYAIELSSHEVPFALIITCIIIQYLQLISMGLISPFKFTSFGLNYFKHAAWILYPEHYLRQTSLILYLVPIQFCLTLFHAIIFIYGFKNESRFKIVTHYLFFIFNTVLFAVNALSNFTVFACTQDNPFTKSFPCFKQFHIIYVIFAFFNSIWLVFCTFFVFLFYINRDPFSSDFYATSSNLWIIGKLILKLAPAIYINADPNLEFSVLYIVSFAGLNLVYFGAFKIMWPYFRNCCWLQHIIIHGETVVIFVTAFFILLQFFSNENQTNIVFIMSWIAGNLVGQLLISIFSFQKQRLANIYLEEKEQEQEQEQSQQNYLQFLYILIYQIHKIQKIEDLKILHLLKLHQIKCQNHQCPCREIMRILSKQQCKVLTKQIIYNFVNELIREACSKIKKNNGLKIIQAYICFYKLGQKIKSVHMLSELLKNTKISLTQQIQIRKLFCALQNENKQNTDLKRFTRFSQYFWEFQRQAEKAVINCRKYWTQLIQQDCEITKIWQLANTVQKDKENIEQIVNNKILAIFPNNLQTLCLYSELFSTIYRASPQKMQKCMQKFDKTTNLIKDSIEKDQQLNFRQNQEMTVMCAVEMEGIFQFIRVSSNVINILQIRNIDLINKNINTIIPDIYQQFHDRKVKEYFNKPDGEIQQRNATVYTIASNSVIVNCLYKIKIMPSAKYGLQLICFMRKIKSKEKNQKQFLAYCLIQDSEHSKNKQSPFAYKNGDIIHIDPELKKILYNSEEPEFTENYHSKIEEILPEWDIKLQQYIYSDHYDDGSCNGQFSKIQLVHQDQIQQGVFVKYLCFSSKNEYIRLTIQPYTDKSLEVNKKKIESNLNSSFWSEISVSRLNLNQNQKSYILNPLKMLSQKPVLINKNILLLVACIILAILIILCILVYKLNDQQTDIQSKDFQVMSLSQEISTKIYEVGTQIQQHFKTHTNQTDISVLSYTDLSQINRNVKNIYDIFGIQALDSAISIKIQFFSKGAVTGSKMYSLNNAVSYLTTIFSNILIHLSGASEMPQIYMNIEQVFYGCFQIMDLSLWQTNSKLKSVIKRQILLESFQLIIVFIIAILIIYRVLKVYAFAESALSIYEEVLDINQLKEYSKRCQCFEQKIKGVNQYYQNQKNKKIKDIFTQFQNLVANPTKKLFDKSQKCNQGENDADENKRQQQQKLLSMRKKITFQEGPKRVKYIFYTLFIISFWIAVKAGLKFKTNFTEFENKINKDRLMISQNYMFISEIQKMLFYFNARDIYKQKFNQNLLQVNHRIMKMSYDDINLKQQINLHGLIETLTQLKVSPNSIDPESVHEKIANAKGQMKKHTAVDININDVLISERRTTYELAIQIIVSAILILCLWKLAVIQEDIRIGCCLMLDMIGETAPAKDFQLQKSNNFSPKLIY